MAYQQAYGRQESPSAEIRRSPVMEAFATLDSEIDALAKQCEVLEMRLELVLAASIPRAEKEGVDAVLRSGPIVPLVSEIWLRRDRIGVLAHRLVELHARLGV